MKIYATGGTGINVVRNFIKYQGKPNPGFTDMECVFIDTSKSNIDPSIPKDSVYLLEDLDGSGKLRASNYTALSESSKEILHKHRPGDINLVVHSASGGTGSVMGPILVSEMLARGENVITIVVGSTGSRIETENTAKTLKSYEVISHKREMPVIVCYRENSSDKPRGQVDSEAQTFIVFLALVFSGDNRELDMADLKNFLNYHKVTTYTPRLSYLDFFSKDIEVGKGQAVASLVSLVDEKSNGEANIPTEYHAVGYISEAAKQAATVSLPIHACVIVNYFHIVIDRLDKKIASYDEVRKTVNDKAITSRDTKSTDDGLIL